MKEFMDALNIITEGLSNPQYFEETRPINEEDELKKKPGLCRFSDGKRKARVPYGGHACASS